jgi:ATP-binding cassette subfamily B protein RaxB
LLAITTLAMMIAYSGLLSTVALIAVGLYTAIRVAVFTPLRTATEEQIVLAARQQTTFLESIRGIQAIKLFGKENQRLSMWHNRLVDTTNRLLRTQRFVIGYRFANGALSAVENILVIWLGAHLILGNRLSIGMLFAFVAYKGVFSSRMSSLVDKIIDVRMLHLQGERLADIVLSAKEEAKGAGVAGSFSDTALAVRHLSFRYSDLDPFVLRGLNLTIPAGASVAITGPSGCGKTTLAKLLLGLLRPTEGSIHVGNAEVGQLGLTSYRSNVGSVMQDDQLFAGSVAENIAFFDDTPDRHRIEQAARLAHVHGDVERMTMGYHTLIGDMGTSLSGGQKQRVLIARALYKNPQILVLDEATSHLDVELEKAVNDAVRSLRITRVVIAHRPETIAACDLVIELPQLNRLDVPGDALATAQ